MSWDDAVLYNDYEGMKECYAKLQEELKNQKIITDSYIQLHKEAIERVVYLDGLTDGDVAIITKLQVENGELKHTIATGYCGECDVLKEDNKQLQERNIDLYVHTARLVFELEQNKQKLEAMRSQLCFFESLEVNLEEIKAKDIVKHFRKVLGFE